MTRKHPHAGQTGAMRDFLKLVHDLARSGHSYSEVFSDFLELSFCAVAKGTSQHIDDQRAFELESRYMRRVTQRNNAEYIRKMPELLQLLCVGLEEPCDFLGRAAGELGALHEGMGQFFTPYELSATIARLNLDPGFVKETIARRGYITVGEPACGAGGMVLAVADALMEMGYQPTYHMLVEATDLSETAIQMTYVQIGLRGVPGYVLHGNTITQEMFARYTTPGTLVFAQHQAPVLALRRAFQAIEMLGSSDSAASNEEAKPEAPAVEQPADIQLELFK